MRELRKDIDLTKKGGRTDAWRDTDRVQIYEFHGREPRQVQEFLTKVYAENEFKSVGERAHFRTDIRTNAYADVGLCKVRHAAPFLFESTTPRDTFLVFSCTGGAGTLQADDGKISVHRNRSVPISATGIAAISGEPSLTHLSMHIDTERVHSLCAQWIGSPLGRPLVFDLKPFTPDLAGRWQRIIKAMDALMDMGTPPQIALVSLRECAIDALLQSHPHTYTRFLRKHAAASARLVRDAMRLMEEQADSPVAVADIASALGCSIQSLHRGFREHQRITPGAFLYSARLNQVRNALMTGNAADTAAETASQFGFVNYDRFSAEYSDRFGEHPEETFHRRDGAHNPSAQFDITASGPILTDAKAEMLGRYIDSHMDNRIRVRLLAQKANMSVQNFIVAFTKAFGITPAQYVIGERIRRACWLLANTNESISSIAAETGFSSQSHLTTTLKQHEGITPIQYRRSSTK
jgi:transcriptional regulator GlxA family with amidase domain